MKVVFRVFPLCLLLMATSAWASVVGSTNPNLFPDTVDWCTQASFSCDGNAYGSFQSWTSLYGNTGSVGLLFSNNDFQVLQAGNSLFGSSYPDGMGVLYNGVSTLGNPEDVFAVIFDQPQWGAGAYIQTWYYGPFTAEVELYDTSLHFMGAYTINGVSSDQLGDLAFIGARSSTGRDVGAAIFSAVDSGGFVDYSIGTMGLATPEPSTILLLAPSALGLIGLVRRRLSRKSQEVL